ncbi:MAG: DUF2786 domain-containing protein [Deltaproteobacteria bacterium]|nr:DUF2786 domain-containing protein [Deltaproteobacteria bacterium]
MPDETSKESIAEDLKRIVLKKLRSQWHALASSVCDARKLGLKPPLIDIEPLKGSWGCWIPENRLVVLSEKLVLEGSWNSILGVFGHEVAHQMVSEVFSHLVDETRGDSVMNHGFAFHYVHKGMGLDPYFSKASIDMELEGFEVPSPYGKRRNEANAHPVLAKVKKLLALASSAETHESAAALAAAKKLLAKHNLDNSDLEFGEESGFERWTMDIGPRLTFKHDLIAVILEEHFFVTPIYVPEWNHLTGEKRKLLELIGRPVSLAMAEYVFRFLEERCDTLWEAHKPLALARGEKGTGVRNCFVRNLLLGFGDKLRAEKELAGAKPGDSSSAISDKLILKGHDERMEYLKKCHPRISKSSRSGGAANAPGAANAGWKAGKELTIHAPVGNKGAGGPRQRIGGGG